MVAQKTRRRPPLSAKTNSSSARPPAGDSGVNHGDQSGFSYPKEIKMARSLKPTSQGAKSQGSHFSIIAEEEGDIDSMDSTGEDDNQGTRFQAKSPDEFLKNGC